MSNGRLIIAAIFTLISTDIFAEIQRGVSGHSQGDVIAVQRDEDVASFCDFNKQIVVTATNVLCVYNGKSRS